MRITEILENEQVIIPLKATGRDSAIEELINAMSKKIAKPKQAYEAVLEREKIMSTAVGKGVAIPHCKNDACPEFVIALGVSPQGLTFDAPDDRAVHLVFLLVGPENNPGMHIKYLSRISKLVNDAAIRGQLEQCKDAAGALELIRQYESAVTNA